MTDREQIVRQIASVRNAYIGYVGPSLAREILSALEAAGYAVYRPEDCEGVTVEVMNVARRTGPIDGFYDAGAYRLVPDGGGS